MISKKPKAAFFAGNEKFIDKVYGAQRRAEVESRCDLYPYTVSEKNFSEHVDRLQDLEVIFSTWSMPHLGETEIAQLPALKAVFYAAGSVQGFARPFLKSNIRVFSAWAANAIPVAEFSLAQILLSCKGYFRNTRDCQNPAKHNHTHAHQGPGIYSNTVALIGFGMIGRKLAELLQPFQLNVLVVDPYVDEKIITDHGAKRATMEEAFETAQVVSNHLPNLPATEYMLNGALFRRMKEYATFVNTGRGKQVKEDELIEVLRERPDLTALLDVTYPEPPSPNSPFYSLPNVQLSSHIAGSIGIEVGRMADFVIEEFDLMTQGNPLRYEVTEKMLETMA
ncbi:MAG: hydroxyacid dehydrogenase [Verrucomicrobia bacterium]|nr:hydroxyacid dehydrogenase [Verrucomicrobiota bacterium]MCH8510479.1 hydroxyacid dehydrogenase [Kiritimatiellia bacterium]